MPASPQIIHGELAGVINQVRQRVVARVDGPDDFVQRLDGLPRGGGNFSDALAGLVRLAAVLPGQFAQEGDLRQVRAEVIVDVLGDAGAFLVAARPAAPADATARCSRRKET